jgi:aminoglycoside phosphotransferase (APT) family kinase protein
MAAVAPRLAAVGVPVARLVPVDGAHSGILATEFIEGATAASLLGDPGGPALVGRAMGALWRQLLTLETRGLPLGTTPATPDVIAASAGATLARVAASSPALDVRRLADAIRTVPELLAGRPSGFVHGDFVPANVLVREGAVVALLDFEAARLGDPLFDAAWFRWIVGYHHPESVAVAWDAFRTAAEIDATDPVVRDLLRLLPAVGLLERLDATTAEREAEHWLAMLRRTGLAETSFPSVVERKYGPTRSNPV